MLMTQTDTIDVLRELTRRISVDSEGRIEDHADVALLVASTMRMLEEVGLTEVQVRLNPEGMAKDSEQAPLVVTGDLTEIVSMVLVVIGWVGPKQAAEDA